MNRKLLAKLLGLMLVFSGMMTAEVKLTLPLPDPGNVTLTLDEYNKLIELAAKPVKPIEVPPLPYSLKQADLKLHIENETVRGSLQLDGEIFRKGTTKVPLTTGMTLLDAHQGNKAIPLRQENGTETAMLPGPAEFSIVLDSALPLRIEAGRAFFSLPVPAAGSVRLALLIPGDHSYVNITPGVIISRKSERGHTAIEATLVPGQPANVWWATREAPTPAAAREVRFLSEVKTLISVSEAELKLAALIDTTVVQGEPTQFEVEVPSGYELTGATGPSLDSSGLQAGVLTLKLSATGQRSYQFLITLEKSITGSQADGAFLNLKGAQRETGEVLVEGAGTIQLSAREGGNLKRMDVKEANAYLRSLAHFPPQAAFRYHRQPNEAPTLALEWVRFPDSSVLAAVAEHAVVTTLVTSEGKSLTEVRLTLKNQAQPFLKVALPQGAGILSAEVAGETVKPVQAADGNRVPLLRPGFRTPDAYDVSFVFMHSGAPFAKKGGSELSLPQMDVPINLLDWEVFLPPQFKVKDFAGDVISANLVPPALLEGQTRAYGTAAPGPPPATINVQPLFPGQLGGYIVDPAGAVVPNARVTVEHPDTGATMSTVADQNGRWLILNQPSGRVRITADGNGFRRTIRDLSYDATRPVQNNLTLEVGAGTENVEVIASTSDVRESERAPRDAKKQSQLAQQAASMNVINLQRRVAGVLPVAIDVPRAGTSFRFVRPLVLEEETKVTFAYKSK
jgi:Carboxypeptidase regulatory-like domain